MSEDPDQIQTLYQRLSALMSKQESFQKEIEGLKEDILKLQSKQTTQTTSEVQERYSVSPVTEMSSEMKPKEAPVLRMKMPKVPEKEKAGDKEWRRDPHKHWNLEKFIGENLINKIGIIITIIGVGIGAKYAIDHRLISPLTRIILGYFVGISLLGFAIYLRKQYENFSAVLLSGSMAIIYFITFAAYSFYELIPLTLTFIIMAMITIVTVIAAIRYNRQVIAHIGLVGAYAVPFLLSDGSGRVLILFSYMAIINVGILVIAFNKYWKLLHYSSFIFTWLIFATWFIMEYNNETQFGLTWTFLAIFFVTFYLILLANKLLKQEKLVIDDIVLILANSFLFFGIGYSLLHQNLTGQHYLGLFTIGNAIIHGAAGLIISRKQADKNLIYFITGLFITFFTIAVPVQFHGSIVTMIWAVEAAILYWIGKSNKNTICELLTYPVMILAFCNIVIHWPVVYNTTIPMQESSQIMFLFNINVLTSIVVIVSFSFINYFYFKRPFISLVSQSVKFRKFINFILPVMLLTVIYFSFFLEIRCFWDQLFTYGAVDVTKSEPVDLSILTGNANIPEYKTLSLLIYSVAFFSVLSFVNILKLEKRILGLWNLAFNTLVVIFFLTFGLYSLGILRDHYLSQALAQYFYRGFLDIGIRYVAFIALGVMLYATFRYIRQDFLRKDLILEFDILLHISILSIASNELINWMDLAGSHQTYKLGLSILFGVYALLMIALGIWKKKLHLRIGAIVLFSFTLLKLFFYDLTSLNTISKTIVFVVLGVLLLVISFLYTKYRKVIFEEKS